MTVSRTGKLNHRIVFKERDGYSIGPNGTKIPIYKEVLNPWFGYKQKFLSEIKGEDISYKDTINIVLRQKQKKEILPDWIGEIKGTDYSIIEINPDLENGDFMVLILKAVK